MSAPGSRAVTLRRLLLALVPGIAVQTAVFGFGSLFNVLLCAAGCVVLDAACLRVRGQASIAQLRTTLADGSALLSGTLLGLALPALGPWWLPLLGAALAMVVGRHLLGPRGASPFNPAMVGLALLLLSVPQAMTHWLPPVDGLSSATLLDQARTGLHLARTLDEIFGSAGLHQRGEAWINLAFLAGGLWLLRRRQLAWQIPAGVLAGIALPALLFWAGDTSLHPSPLFQLFSGATMLGAFFIATAPPSSPRHAKARFGYGLGIGLTAYAIRSWGAYPEGFAFAVLLFNAAAPALDLWAGGATARAPRPRLLAVALALAAVAALASLLIRQQRADAIPDPAMLGIAGGTVGSAETIHDSAFGDFRRYPLTRDGVRGGVILRTAADGYVGTIDVLTAINADGRIAGVRVLHHDETRGIGDRIELARDRWILGFDGKSAGDADIDQLSGATISAHAVGTAVRRSLDYDAAHRSLLSAP